MTEEKQKRGVVATTEAKMINRMKAGERCDFVLTSRSTVRAWALFLNATRPNRQYVVSENGDDTRSVECRKKQ